MQVSVHQAEKHLSRLVRAAVAGEDITISSGDGVVRLVPIARQGRLRGWGKLRQFAAGVDAAFTPEVDAAVARRLQNQA